MEDEPGMPLLLEDGRPEAEYYGYAEMIIDTEGVFRGGAGSFGSKIDMIEGDPAWLKKGRDAVFSETYGVPIKLR